MNRVRALWHRFALGHFPDPWPPADTGCRLCIRARVMDEVTRIQHWPPRGWD